MIREIKKFIMDEEGATAVEYGIMVAGIAAVIVTVVALIGTSLNGTFSNVNDAIAPPAATP